MRKSREEPVNVPSKEEDVQLRHGASISEWWTEDEVESTNVLRDASFLPWAKAR